MNYRASFNDEEVLAFNKGAVTQPTRKMAQCTDYPEPDLADFYYYLAHCDLEEIELRWVRKAFYLQKRIKVGQSYVRRKNGKNSL